MNTMQITSALAGIALAFACGSSPATATAETTPTAAPATPVEQAQPAPVVDQPVDTTDGLFAIISTRLGTIKVKLAYKDAPMTVANFVALAEGKQHNSAKPDGTPYYDGTIFHRVIAGFMIQGGDPNGTGAGGPGYTFPDELDPSKDSYKAGYVRGAVAMANRGPNTNGSQFFIMHKDYGLPHNYSIFGQVVSGMETVDAIATLPRNAQDRPNEEVSMKVKIEAVGKDAKAFDAKKVLEDNKSKFQIGR
jgi:cyclophilin family peptidyl-prolyl cis-trans isomerase